MAGPRIVVDSSGTEPRLELRSNEYVLHLPVGMARVLYDSLPGFSPLQVSVWHPGLVATIASANPGVALPSVVLGDFNGDSRLDVAMEGNAGQIGATFILLAKSDSVPTPRLVFIDRGDAIKGSSDSYISLVRPKQIKVDPELEQETLDLRTDAVQLVLIDRASVLYYLDHGAVRRYTTSD